MAEVGNLVVRVGMDSTGFNTSISKLNRQLRVVKSEFQAASSKLGSFGNSTEQLRLKAESLNKQIEIQKQKVEALKNSYEKSVATKGEDDKATQNLAVRYNKAQAELNKLENELKQTNTTIEQQTSKLNKLSSTLQNVGNKMKTVGDKISTTGKSLTTKVSLPLIGIGTAASKMAIDFENGMAKVKTIADTTQKPIQELRKELLNLSNATGISVNELTEAEYQAISAGVDTANSVKFLETATKAAKGGFTDTTTAINGLTTVLNAYGLKADEVTKISDQMLVAQNFGKTSFGEMAQSIGNVIPIASQLNISTEELFASIATLTKNGIQTSQAITGLKAAYSNIMKPSKQASDLAKELGLNFNSAHLQSVGWAKFLDKIREKTGGNTEQMATLFGSVEALNSVMVLAGKGSKDFTIALEQMKNSTGATQKAFDEMNNTTGAKLSKSFNKLKNAGIKMGDTLAPHIEKLANIITKLADKFNSLSPAQQEMILKLGLLVAAIGPALLVFGKLTSGIGSAISIGSKLVANWGTISGTATKFAGFLKPLLGGLFTPWGLAIVGAVAAGYLIVKNWDKIKEGAKKLKENLSEKFNNIKQNISNKWNEIRENTSKAWGLIKGKIEEHGGGIKGVIGTYTEAYKGIWNKSFNFMDDLTGGKMSSIANTIADKVSNIKSNMLNTWTNIKSNLTDTWNSLKASASNIFKNIADAIVKPFKNIHIPMPHFDFSVTHKEIAGISIPVPKVDVDWYDKGGIFTRPSIIGVGEKRPEFVGALEDLRYLIRDELMRSKTTNVGGINIVVQNMTVRNDNDIRKVAEELHVLTQNSLRARGIG